MDRTQITTQESAENGVILQSDSNGDFIFTETSGEYILPDYLPEIRKILRISSKVIPSGKFISGGKAEFAGNVIHTIVYSDGEGRVASSTQNGDYEFSVPISEEAGGVTACCDSNIDHISYRLGGPRKINIRSYIKSDVHMFSDRIISVNADKLDAPDVEKLKKNEYSMVTLCANSGEISLSDSYTLEGYSPDSVKIIYCDGRVLVREARAVPGGVMCRGDVNVKCIFAPDEGGAFTQIKKIPFEHMVATDGAEAGMNAVANGYCVSIDVSMSQSDGSANVTLDVLFVLDVRCYRNNKICLISDMYSTSCEYNCKYEKIPISHFIGSEVSNFSIDGVGEDTKGEQLVSIIDTEARAEVKEISVEKNKPIIIGNCIVNVLATVASESPVTQYATFEFTVPFRYESNLKVPDDAEFECHAEVVSCRARIDTKGIVFDGEIAIWICARENVDTDMLVSAVPDTEARYPEESAMTVCYPDGRSLWEISKKYRVHPSDVADGNGLPAEVLDAPNSADSLDGVMHLIIEKQ